MDLTLVRHNFDRNGVEGEMLSPQESVLFYTLEHSYLVGGVYAPKVMPGTYQCVKGSHRLANSRTNLYTYELKNVPGHSGILIHPGNTQHDSCGCILIGKSIIGDSLRDSRIAFEDFLLLEQGVDSFLLTVR
jgi:hypothetical protein